MPDDGVRTWRRGATLDGDGALKPIPTLTHADAVIAQAGIEAIARE